MWREGGLSSVSPLPATQTNAPVLIFISQPEVEKKTCTLQGRLRLQPLFIQLVQFANFLVDENIVSQCGQDAISYTLWNGLKLGRKCLVYHFIKPHKM